MVNKPYIYGEVHRNIFNQLENEGMQRFELVTNFRSHFEIVNYANLMHNASQFRDDYSKEVTHVVHCGPMTMLALLMSFVSPI